MKRLFSSAEDVVLARSPEGAHPVWEALLAFISVFYRGAVALRAALYRRGVFKSTRLPCTVVSVGNLTLGGTGKTPVTMAAARTLLQNGFSVAVLSRGYGGSLSKKGGMVSDGKSLLAGASRAGDEPLLMARSLPGVPVAVGRDRARMGKEVLRRFAPQVLLLDDGFQHLALARDVDIVLADASSPLANGRVFPRGPLREPEENLLRAHALVLTRANPEDPESPPSVWPEDRPVFYAFHRPVGWTAAGGENSRLTPGRHMGYQLKFMRGKRLAAFSGIADNRGFFSTLGSLGTPPVVALEFADHHAYDPADVERIVEKAREAGADCVATTEKDLARLDGWPREAPPLFALRIEAAFTEPEAFERFLVRSVKEAING
ncbi:MAG: tetraacyldisaccharide 4'-kinase [Deltaproteobacteria bacterium]|nr:tetraacyldisaccharide 4'-kinase [Deltaproteobacteria bacterium]